MDITKRVNMAHKSSKSEAKYDQLLSDQMITLRPMVLSDIDDFLVWTTDDRVSHFCGYNTFTSKDQALNYFKTIVEPHPWFRVICIDNRAIGSISMTPDTGLRMCRGEIGCALGYKYWGKGIVTRAVKIVISIIFYEMPELKRIEALVYVENKGSQRVLEKVGFQRDCVLRKYVHLKGKFFDIVMYSFLSSDPCT